MSTRIAVRKILVGLLGAILTTTVIFNTRHPPAKGDGNMLVAFAAANAHRVVPRTVVVIERVTSPIGEYPQRRTMKGSARRWIRDPERADAECGRSGHRRPAHAGVCVAPQGSGARSVGAEKHASDSHG